MNVITWTDLRQLADAPGPLCISLYLPAHTGAESRQNPVRFKNLLREAEDRLAEREVGKPTAQDLLAPARRLLQDTAFWSERAHGLAVLIDQQGARIWHLPFACADTCVVGNHFHVMPLLAWLSQEATYHVLAVSQNNVRLFHGSRGDIEFVEVPGLPSNREQALGLDTPEPAQQAHSGEPHAPGKEGMVFHGQGGAVDESEQEIVAYFREIDRALEAFLHTPSEPLIFAGVDYLFPIYASVNTHPYLLATAIPGNPELLSPTALRERAWPLADSANRERRAGELAKYWNSVSQGRVMNQLDEIVVAAQAGAVGTLLVDVSATRYGSFFPEATKVNFRDHPSADAEDLVNLAAILVLRSSGWVEVLETDHVPGGGTLAAVLRYEFTPADAGATMQSRK
jgi:hypothetical protein